MFNQIKQCLAPTFLARVLHLSMTSDATWACYSSSWLCPPPATSLASGIIPRDSQEMSQWLTQVWLYYSTIYIRIGSCLINFTLKNRLSLFLLYYTKVWFGFLKQANSNDVQDLARGVWMLLSILQHPSRGEYFTEFLKIAFWKSFLVLMALGRVSPYCCPRKMLSSWEMHP